MIDWAHERAGMLDGANANHLDLVNEHRHELLRYRAANELHGDILAAADVFAQPRLACAAFAEQPDGFVQPF
jgi:hypothetical protein